MKTYLVYKGLQKPLIFKGFKGRYIYWGAGAIIGGFIAAGLIGAIFNLFMGAGAMLVITVGGIFYISQKQKGGLYDKKRSKGEYYIMGNNLKKMGEYVQEKNKK